MKKSIALLALFAPLLLIADTIKIGVILPLSGNVAVWGEKALPALELFEKELAQNDYRHDYQLIVEDDQMTARNTAQVTQKLINVDKVDAIVSFSSGTGNVVAPQTARKDIVHLCLASDFTIASKHNMSFVHWMTPKAEAQAYTQLLQQIGTKRLGIISLHHQGVYAIEEELKPMLAEAGIELVEHQHINPTQRDFRVILSRMAQKDIDALAPLTFSPGLEIIIRQAQELALNVPLPNIEVYDFIDPNELHYIDQQYYVSASLGTQAFRDRLQQQTGKVSQYSLPYVYNCLDFLRQAYETMEHPDNEAATRYIMGIQNQPTAVGQVSCSAERFIDSPAAFFQVEGKTSKEVTLDEIR